jgi:hypothetical protein
MADIAGVTGRATQALQSELDEQQFAPAFQQSLHGKRRLVAASLAAHQTDPAGRRVTQASESWLPVRIFPTH